MKFRIRAHRALISCYRLVPEMEKMAGSVEYIIAHSESSAEKSITRTSYMSYLHQRGLTDDAVKRYDKQLKQNRDNQAALYLLSEIYSRLKDDPAKSIELTNRLMKLQGKEETVDPRENARLASQYIRAKKYKEGAELYEKIANLDKTTQAWHWKEAAAAWAKLGDKENALAAAKQSDASPPEERAGGLVHFWHKGLADVFMQVDQPKLAIPHYKAAIETTEIQGYIDSSKIALEKAQSAVKK